MKISRIELYAYNIPMKPFIISLGTLYEAKNVLVKLFTGEGITGWGEGSPFPMIVGETQESDLALARDFSNLLLSRDALDIPGCMKLLNDFVPNNPTVKSAFDMALYDISAQHAGLPLYRFLGGERKVLVTDHTVSIGTADEMATAAGKLKDRGVTILKLKVGSAKKPGEDIERVKAVRAAVGGDIPLRLDANQGWTVPHAVEILSALKDDHVQFCEQPVRHFDYDGLKYVSEHVSIPVMADESCFYAYQARYIAAHQICPHINIKLAKSGGMLEATQIAAVTKESGITCMLGGMIESKLALTANAHFACAHSHILFYDLDYCFNHHEDPVVNGVEIKNECEIHLPDMPGIGATVDEKFLSGCSKETITD
jgi:L-alanine-DL-glutamate epimerase-like enolase superfamily enzyme